MNILSSCLPVVSSLILASALGAQLNWGADADGHTAARSGTSGSTSPFFFGNSEDSGGEGAAFDAATGTDARATFTSEAALLGDLGTFASLSTRVETFLNASAEARSVAIESFTYTGASAAEFSLAVNLSGLFENSPNDPSGFAGNFANVYVIFDTFDDSFESIRFGAGELWFSETETSLAQSSLTTVLSDTLTFTVDPDQTFQVYAIALSRMFGEEGLADASSTLTVGFTGGPVEELLRSSAIPEPGALALLLGLGATSSLLWRRQR
jgi:hypothetical protein